MRGVLIRCPNCGAPFMRGFRLLPTCPQCGLRLDRGEEGHFLGSMTFNMVASELVVLALLVVALVRSLPESPPFSVYLAGVVLALVLPVLFYPFSKTIWLAFDLTFRPSRPSDFS
jgi:uncharacterized protein (DUF983 family)